LNGSVWSQKVYRYSGFIGSILGVQSTSFPGMGQRVRWSFEDPAAFAGSEAEKLGKFREVRDQIEQRIKAWLLEQKKRFKS